MDQRSPIEGRYRFGPFLLDPAERLVTREGAPVTLTTRLFELLLAFVRSPGRLLSKSDLMEAVWSDRVVDEGSLTQAIFSLRKALGDGDGHYITTVTGRGYSFSATVENIGAPPRPDAAREALAPSPAASPEAPSITVPVRKWSYAYLAGALAIVIAVAAFFLWQRNVAPAGKPLTVVVADFQNLSNNPLFDRTFTMATKSDLQQSPRLSVMPDGLVGETLELMTRPRDAKLTPALAQEICARNNGQAMVNGTIAQVGGDYLLTLTAADCVSGRILWTDKAEVNSLNALLPSLDRLAEGVRRELGESADSIEKFNVPMVKQQTASFDALRAYSEAFYDFAHGKYTAAVPLFQHAIEIDPKFAAAYDGLATTYANIHEHKLDIANATKAYELRNYAAEKERLHISMRYESSVLGDIRAAIRTLREWTELYPNDASAWANLSNLDVWIGDNAAGIRDGKQAVALNSAVEASYVTLARAYLHSNQFDLAAATCAQAVARHIESFDTHRILYDIAFVRRDATAMNREMEWASGKPAERFLLIEAGQVAIAQGQIEKAQQIFARAVDLGKTLGLVNFMAPANARLSYDLGMKDSAVVELGKVPANYDSEDYRFSNVEFGDEAKGIALLDADLARSPSDTLLVENYAPEIRAASALRHNQPAKAVIALAATTPPMELHTYDVVYVHGIVYLAAGDGKRAAIEFHKIVDNPGVEPVSVHYPLAWLGLARALFKVGRIAESRAAYQKLFSLWKDADRDLPALQDANREFAAFSPS